MIYNFSNRIAAVQPSAIREILKSTSDPNVISFAAGNPAPEAFPVKSIENIIAIIMGDTPVAALQYSVSEGYAPLREAARSFACTREQNLAGGDDSLIIVSGAQQGIDLTIKCLINEGDTVLSETPSFVSALNTIRSYGANLVGIPMDSDGIDLALLEKALCEQPNVKLLYTIPNFQNPTGITMSPERRKAVYELCRSHGVMILEDNPYGDLCFSGKHPAAIKALDTEGIVIYVGTFSKIIAPGLRVGYVIANKDFMPKLVVAKQCSDVHTNILAQMVCERFLMSCNMNSHLFNLQKIYDAKAELMINSLSASCGKLLSWNVPAGGLFLWCTLPEGVDMTGFCKASAAAGVAVVPGSAFLTDEHAPCQSFRINYSTPSNEQIVRGAGLLGDALKDFVR
ncbi:MAG: PLP-dependent aminotransferase family protein [Angelakisella sp.]